MASKVSKLPKVKDARKINKLIEHKVLTDAGKCAQIDKKKLKRKMTDKAKSKLNMEEK